MAKKDKTTVEERLRETEEYVREWIMTMAREAELAEDDAGRIAQLLIDNPLPGAWMNAYVEARVGVEQTKIGALLKNPNAVKNMDEIRLAMDNQWEPWIPGRKIRK